MRRRGNLCGSDRNHGWKSDLLIRQPASWHLFKERACDTGRIETNAFHLCSVFHMRHHGYDDRDDTRPGLFNPADDCIPFGSMRIAYYMDSDGVSAACVSSC